MNAIFHLSLPAVDLAAMRTFYCDVLGAIPGRATTQWIDLILFGHQLTFHQQPEQVRPPDAEGVRHFGAILPWDTWVAVCAMVQARQLPVHTAATIREAGSEREHGKIAFRDPSGHLLEFKAYRNLACVFPAQA